MIYCRKEEDVSHRQYKSKTKTQEGFKDVKYDILTRPDNFFLGQLNQTTVVTPYNFPLADLSRTCVEA